MPLLRVVLEDDGGVEVEASVTELTPTEVERIRADKQNGSITQWVIDAVDIGIEGLG